MAEARDPVHATALIPRALYKRLKARLLHDEKSLSGWIREQAEAYTRSK